MTCLGKILLVTTAALSTYALSESLTFIVIREEKFRRIHLFTSPSILLRPHLVFLSVSKKT